MLKRLSVITIGLMLAGANTSLAQRIEIEPYLGTFIPVTDLVDEEVASIERVVQQKSGFALGGRLTLWLAGPIGVEGNFVYGISDGELKTAGVSDEASAGVWAADARVILNILPGPIGMHINGGIALIGRTGDAYQDFEEGKTDVGGVGGVGVRLGLPGGFGVRANGDVYIYSAQLTLDDPSLGGLFEFGSHTQADLVFSVGLVIPLSG